jgi:hypothetical protein
MKRSPGRDGFAKNFAKRRKRLSIGAYADSLISEQSVIVSIIVVFEFSGAGSRQWMKRDDGTYESDGMRFLITLQLHRSLLYLSDSVLNGASFARHGGSDRDNDFAFAKRAQFAKRGGTVFFFPIFWFNRDSSVFQAQDSP